jgi:hypothetical protein
LRIVYRGAAHTPLQVVSEDFESTQESKLMAVRFHPHALERLQERGATEEEVTATVEQGEQFQGRFGRTGFRRNFRFNSMWRGNHYHTKQAEAYAVQEGGYWLVITIITRYF